MNRLLRCIAVVSTLPATALGAVPDVEALIGKLARKPPATIAFTEARFSPLLVEPLIVAGELSYLGAGSFDRRVTTPYRESTSIRGGSVRIEREDEPARSFALKRAPELDALLAGFMALLSGDASAVGREFSVVGSGDDVGWTLELTPLDRSSRRHLQHILVSGAASEPHCFAVLSTQGGASVMLLGTEAAPPVAPDATLDTLLSVCRAE